MQGFTPTGSRSRLVYDFGSGPAPAPAPGSGQGRSPSPPRVVAAVTKPPSPEKGAPPYRSASPVRYSPPPRPQVRKGRSRYGLWAFRVGRKFTHVNLLYSSLLKSSLFTYFL